MKKGAVLKVTAAIALLFTGFPLLLICDANTYGNTEFLRLLADYGIMLAAAAVGYAASKLLPEKKLFNVILRVLGFLMFFAGMLSLLMGGDFVTVFALGSNCILAYFVGERFGRKIFADLYPLFALGIFSVLGIACYVFAIAALEGEHLELVKNGIVICYAAEFAAAALLVNQSGIFERANRRKETKSSLPKGLSAYNAALVLVITVLGLLLCIFRTQIGDFLSQAALAAAELAVTIAGLFDAEKWSVESGERGDVSFTWLGESYTNYLLQIILTLIAIAVIIVFRKQLFEFVKDFIEMIAGFFSSRTEESERAEFTDVFEDFRKEKKNREKRTTLSGLKTLYKSEKDPVKKFRAGYRLILLRIKSLNSRLLLSDTPTEQAEKGANIYDVNELKAVAGCYDRLRYNDETVTAEELENLDSLLGKEQQ